MYEFGEPQTAWHVRLCSRSVNVGSYLFRAGESKLELDVALSLLTHLFSLLTSHRSDMEASPWSDNHKVLFSLSLSFLLDSQPSH
jgi:hypothetical protein